MDDEWYPLDHERIADILADANYTDWISLEMEGKEDVDRAVAQSIEMLRKTLGGVKFGVGMCKNLIATIPF